MINKLEILRTVNQCAKSAHAQRLVSYREFPLVASPGLRNFDCLSIYKEAAISRNDYEYDKLNGHMADQDRCVSALLYINAEASRTRRFDTTISFSPERRTR